MSRQAKSNTTGHNEQIEKQFLAIGSFPIFNSLYVWAPINTLRYEQQLLLIPQGTALLL